MHARWRKWRIIFFMTLAVAWAGSHSFAQGIQSKQAQKKPPAPISSKTLSVSPARLEQCKAPVVAQVSWNIQSRGAKDVHIFVAEPNVPEKLFTFGGLTGTAATGPWAKAGMIFVARDKASGEELGRTVIESIPCK